jgi:hypothetical protein
MNNEFNKNQINRIATPIKIDSSGKPITSAPKEVVIVKKNKNNNRSSFTTLLVVILLFILAIIAFLILYIIVPETMNDSKNNYVVEDTTTTMTTGYSYVMNYGIISDEPHITTIGDYIISDNFTITITSSNNGISVLCNGVFVASGAYLSNKSALVDDVILLNIVGYDSRSSKLYVVDSSGNVVNTLYEITSDGMVLNGGVDIQYNRSSFIVSTSRVIDNKIYLNSNSNEYLDICDYKTLGENDIDDSFPVISYYSMEYIGNHEFSNPVLVSSISLSDYRDTNNYCN